MQQKPQHLLQLVYASEDTLLQQIKPKLSGFSKYFFNLKRNITLVYDTSTVYVIHKDIHKVIELPKPFVITDLAYNFDRNVLFFCTIEGHLYVYFPSVKHLIPIRKDYKRVLVMDWIYGSPQAAHLFVAEDGGVHFYRFEEQKKIFKETKHVSGKYHCFLYEPIGQILVGFPYGDCQTAFLFNFQPVRAKYWFKAGQLQFTFDKDEVMTERIKKNKSFGLESSRTCKEVLRKQEVNQDYFLDCLRICNCTYLCFYMASQGKLRLVPVDEQSLRKPITIKLPSDSLPLFNIVDNMLTVHLKNQKITFIYDISPTTFQTLVSPYPLPHSDSSITPGIIYNSEFLGRRVLFPSIQICKWRLNLRVIYHFLKNEMLIFQFFNNRSNSKMEIIRWLRENLFKIKPINLSRIWKHIFIKSQRGIHDESDLVTIVQLYSNLFYTLSIDPLASKEALTNILVECLRQCNEFHVKIPDQLEYLATELLLTTKKYEILTLLVHHNMIKADGRIHRLIFNQYLQNKDQILLTLTVDMASLSKDPKEMLRLLLITDRLREGKRFLKSNSDKFQVLQMIEAVKDVKDLIKRRQFIIFVRMFIMQKYPSINSLYLDEAEKKLFA